MSQKKNRFLGISFINQIPGVLLPVVIAVLSPLLAASPNHLDNVDEILVKSWYPNSSHLEKAIYGERFRRVKSGGDTIGAVLFSDLINPIPAYSGRPISILVGIDSRAVIRGLSIIEHAEPILVIGVTETDLQGFASQYVRLSVLEKVRINAFDRPGYKGLDGITGATITAMVLNRSVMTSARAVASELKWPASIRIAEQGSSAADSPKASTTEAGTGEKTSTPESILAPASESRSEPASGSTSKLAPQNLTDGYANIDFPDFDVFETWQSRRIEISFLILGILVLLFILFFQDWIVHHPLAFKRIRLAYLVYTLIFIGYVLSAQLSIVNVLAFMQTMVTGFTWETLMLDPGIFILWGFVAVSLILWGRGVYCGWLCPFGALQEIIHNLANKFSLPSFEFPGYIHERLWAIKYFILIALVGMSLESFSSAAKIAEVEPFKTTFGFHFIRSWGFSLYALSLLFISAFNSKFFCKYLCVLGAGLSILGRFRIFNWLRRRAECGAQCQACAVKCQISAIRESGEIIDTECHHCLECQVLYSNPYICPPLVKIRKRKEGRAEKIKQRISSIEIQ